MLPLNRSTAEIEAEIQSVFGFYPPMFLPMRENALQLEGFWQQTRCAYVYNPLSAVFKEKLAAYLSRYCTVPYCVVCHCCSLSALGKSGNAILSLLERPILSPLDFETLIHRLHTLAPLTTFPADDSLEEQAILDATVLIYLDEDDGSLHQALRQLLPTPDFQNLIAFLAYVQTVHHWVQSDPAVLFEADQRAQDFLAPLLASEPDLTPFFQTYAEKVRQEREQRNGKRRAMDQLAESEGRYRALVETAAQIVWRTDSDGQILEISGTEELGFPAPLPDMMAFLTAVHPEERAGVRERWQEALDNRTPFQMEFRLRRKNGQYIYFSGYAIPVRTTDEQTREWVGTCTDIDERRRLAIARDADYARQRRMADLLQRTLLANLHQEPIPGLAFAAAYEPANTDALVGGDFFDRIPLSDDKIAIVVADVAGKGLEAAVHTAEAKYTLRAYLRESAEPGEILTRLNRFLYDSSDTAESHFLCLALAILDTKTGQTAIAVAGAERPLVTRINGTIEEISVSDVPLGVLPEVIYETQIVALNPGETLLLMTDGVTEVRQDGRIFGSEGVRPILSERRRAPIEEVAGSILETARRFAGGRLSDDACLAVARWTPIIT